MSDSALLETLTAAVASRPEDGPLRLHLAGLLLEAGRQQEAISHAAQALQYAPDNAAARDLMARAIGAPKPEPAQAPRPEPAAEREMDWRADEGQRSAVNPHRLCQAGGEVEMVHGEFDPAYDVASTPYRLC